MRNLLSIKYHDSRPYIDEIYYHKGIPKLRKRYGDISFCKECNKKFLCLKRNMKKNYGVYCSNKCAHKLENNPRWLGKNGELGKPINNGRGYLMEISRNHPFNNNRYVLKHRLIVEKYIGRFLRPEEVVHHINKDITDNRIENLMVLNNRGEHLCLDKWNTINPEYIIFDGSKLEMVNI